MNWRLLTIVNAAIALTTIAAVVFDLSRTRSAISRRENHQTAAQSNWARNQPEDRIEKVRIESVDDLTNARVDDLGAVPAAELTELMHRATPQQLAALALKFNEAPTDARTFGGMAMFFQAWAQLDPTSAVAGSFRLNDVGMRKIAARTVINSISPSAAPTLIGFLSQHPDKDLTDECTNEFVGTLISSWSQLDPEAASAYMDELAGARKHLDYEFSNVRGDIAYNWATLDPEAAVAWAAKQKDPDSYGADLHASAIKGWCRKDVNAAAAYVAGHLDEPDAAQSASSVVNAMFDRDVDQAMSWISQLPTGAPRAQAESRLAELWAAKDPSSTARWVGSLPVDEQTQVVDVIARNWAETNWPDASRWIASLPPNARDAALAAAVNREGATHYESLTDAMSINNKELRDNTLRNLIRNWAYTEPDAAERWVNESGLSNEERDRLAKAIAEERKNAADAQAATSQ